MAERSGCIGDPKAEPEACPTMCCSLVFQVDLDTLQTIAHLSRAASSC